MENDNTSFTYSTADKPATDETTNDTTTNDTAGETAPNTGNDTAGETGNETANTGTFQPPPPSPEVNSPRRLYRTDGPVSGVSAGLAEYFRVDPVLIRIAIVAAAIVGFPMVPLAYVAAWLIIPKADPAPVAPIMAPNPVTHPASTDLVHPDAPAPTPESMSAR